tara:strand:- start:19348 stop:20550 length:1203 start_codon:yes stop_codon:yes gene_type:complete
MKLNICIFVANKDISKTLLIYEDIIDKSLSEFNAITIINFYHFLGPKKNNNTKKNNIKKKNYQKINFFNPKTKIEFEEFIQNKNIYAFDAIGRTFNYFKIRRLIKKKNIKLILTTNLGFISNTSSETVQTLNSLRSKISKKFSRAIYRMLVLFNYFPTIFMYFESRKKIYENCKIKKKGNLQKFVPGLNINYFQNVFRINTKASDNLKKIKNLKKKKIVFLDGNYKHPEIVSRSNLKATQIKKIYFKNLDFLFNKLKKAFKMKIEICLHPSSEKNEYKKFFKKIKVSQFQTQKSIRDAYLVLFHESGSITDAILQKKKIISVQTEILGNYISQRTNIYKDKLKLFSINLDDMEVLEFKELLKKIKKSNFFIEKYIRENLRFEKERGVDKIFRLIRKFDKK